VKQEMMGWQWHPLDHMQVIGTALQTDDHASTSSFKFFAGHMLFLMPNQQYQSTEGNQLFLCKIHYWQLSAGSLSHCSEVSDWLFSVNPLTTEP